MPNSRENVEITRSSANSRIHYVINHLTALNRTALIEQIRTKQSFLCVGLDPEPSKIPQHLHNQDDPVLAFNKSIIDATRDLCVAYKPNLAFYEALGPRGWVTFQETVRYIGPEHLIIADAKRGDIGNTSRMYADAFFTRYNCDAITIAPYMGSDSVQPFLQYPDKWAIVLGLTSNAGSSDFQLGTQDGGSEVLFEKVLRQVSQWGTPENLMFVIGATHPEQFAQVRTILPDHFLLVPGVGAQGGDLDAICQYGLNKDIGLLVNSSRGIIYASNRTDFADVARHEAHKLQQSMAYYVQQQA